MNMVIRPVSGAGKSYQKDADERGLEQIGLGIN